MSDFATLEDVLELSGREYTTQEQERISAILPLVSDALRFEAEKVGKDLDAMMAASETYASVVKLVTVDVVVRAMRQSTTGDAMVQESQAALGYTWSGTYAVPGGGIAQAIMNNDLKRLGLRRQRIGVIDLYGIDDQGNNRNTDG
ncbi:MAG: hypothetical protein IJ110_01395 [Lachnospiraceae bacterium]|nr:hypothetical protein [Lachnospiraceae bacterium]